VQRVVNHKNSEAPAMIVSQETIKGEIAYIVTRTIFGIDVTAHREDWGVNRSANQT
jgi:hypothetical protein